MTEYILDIGTWRCGEDGENALGEGTTVMLNKEGYSCCLGQFAMQVGVPARKMFNISTPGSLANTLGREYDANFVLDITKKYDNQTTIINGSVLANSLMEINDDPDTTVGEKVDHIRNLLEQHGHTLKVINKPVLEMR